MEDIFFVTGNRHKFDEVKKMLEGSEINLLWSDANVIEHKYDSVKEVAIAKALSSMKLIGKPLIVEDTGICFKAYKDFPGPNAKVLFHGIGAEGVLKLLEGKSREAVFRTAMAFARPDLHPIAFVGECNGKIADKISEKIDFDYDVLFIPDGESRTFSEMTKEEKAKYSHRAKAVEEFLRWHKSQKNR